MTMTEEEVQEVSHSNLDQEVPEVASVDKSMKNLSLDVKVGDDEEDRDNEGSEQTESEQTPSEKNVVDEDKGEPEQEELANGQKSSNKKDQHQTRAERLEKQIELDSRSIFVGNITTEATAESLEEHFKDCGEIVRVTILYNKLTGAPKGYAYIEFENVDSVAKALEKKDSELHGETINVAKKRTNVPGYNNNKNNYPRKEWIYPSWQGNVVRQWYYPYSAPAYQNYKPNGMHMPPPPPQNAFYSQYQYVSRPPHNGGQKMPGYSRGYYRGNYRGNYNGRRGNNNYRGPRNQHNGHYSRADSHHNENGDATSAPVSAPSAVSTSSPVSETSEANPQSETVETTSDVPASKVEE